MAEPMFSHVVPRSYWQRGCNDAKAGRPERWPTSAGPYSSENESYRNGYSFGCAVLAAMTGVTKANDCDECDGTGLDPEFPEGALCPACFGTGEQS